MSGARTFTPSPLRGEGWGEGRVLAGALAAGWFACQELSYACGARVTFSLRGQRESNQRERPPRLALSGHPALRVRESVPGFSSGLLPARKGEPIRGLARCAALSSPPHRRPGAPEKQARIVRARSRSAALRALAVASTRRERAALPGAPMARRAGGGKSAGWPAWMPASFSPGQESRRKTPEPARAPGRQDAWRARHRGVVSSWLLLLWTSKGEVTRAPAGARNRFETCVGETRMPRPAQKEMRP